MSTAAGLLVLVLSILHLLFFFSAPLETLSILHEGKVAFTASKGQGLERVYSRERVKEKRVEKKRGEKNSGHYPTMQQTCI